MKSGTWGFPLSQRSMAEYIMPTEVEPVVVPFGTRSTCSIMGEKGNNSINLGRVKRSRGLKLTSCNAIGICLLNLAMMPC